MADIRFVRPQSDNKVRNLSPLPRTNETLHITTPKHTTNRPPRWDFFFTSTPESCPDTNFSSQPVTKRKKSIESLKAYQTDTVRVISIKQHEYHGKCNKALFFHPSNRSSSLANMPKTSHPLGELTVEDILPTSASDLTISSGTKFTTGFETLNPYTSHEPDSRPLSRFIADTENARRCPVMQFYSNFASASDSGLVDVHDEEVEQLPEVQSPSGVFSSPAKQPATPHCALQVEVNVDQPNLKQDITSINTTNVKRLPGRIFKRSVSSCDLDETKYTSFFGSLRKKEETELSEKEEDERDSPDYNFATLWDLRRAWVLDSSIHRAHSADSLMEAKSWQSSPKTSHSLTPVEQLLADEEENEGDDAENTTHNNSKTSWLAGDENCDRLRMRRGALAQPERMIMSQAVREKVQKDIQKRKTSMVRRVSQFFNVQLGLNREEDLI